MIPTAHTYTTPTPARGDRPSPQLLRRWHAATRLIRMQDVARVTQQAGLPLDANRAAQLIHAADEYDAATRIYRAMTQPTMAERVDADAAAIAAQIPTIAGKDLHTLTVFPDGGHQVDQTDVSLLIAASILDA